MGPSCSLALHFKALLLDTNTYLGVQSETNNRDSKGHLFVARNGSRNNKAASLDLCVEAGAAIALGLDSDTHQGHEAGSAGLAAALNVAAANAGLKPITKAIYVRICLG
jgi:hypothetical protein